MLALRLLLAALVFPTFTPSARRIDVTPAGQHSVTTLERLGSVLLDIRDPGAGTVELVSVPSGGVDLHLTQVGGVWTAYPESGGHVLPVTLAITTPDARPWPRAVVSRWHSCWWLWLYTGIRTSCDVDT